MNDSDWAVERLRYHNELRDREQVLRRGLLATFLISVVMWALLIWGVAWLFS